MAPIKLCQINTRRSRKVTPEIRAKAFEEGIDIILVQEPYQAKSKVTGYGISNRIVQSKEGEPWTAIIILNPSICALQITDLCSSHVSVVEITMATKQIYLVSAYFQKRDDIEPHIESLDRVLTRLAGKEVIICIDANAKSPLWGPRNADRKGELLEDFINEKRLQVLNDPQGIATVANEVGEGWVDVTLATHGISQNIYNWKVNKGWSSSDHRAITMEITEERAGTNERLEQDHVRGYNTAKAD